MCEVGFNRRDLRIGIGRRKEKAMVIKKTKARHSLVFSLRNETHLTCKPHPPSWKLHPLHLLNY